MKVVLRQERSSEGTRSLWASLNDNGDLIIEGQDLGSGVETFWGAGLTEYEWIITVRAPNIPRVIAALGGSEGDDLLALLVERFAENQRFASKAFFDEQAVPIEFWNRVGS